MGRFMVRYAEYGDIPAIMDFIDIYWKKGHILSKDRSLFEWQYIRYGKVDFVIGIDSVGQIPYAGSSEKDIALALWKANTCQERPFLGLDLLAYLMDNEKYRCILCPGINMQTTSKIYQYLGMTVNMMRQWYRLREMESYHIADITNGHIPMYDAGERCQIFLCDGAADLGTFFDHDVRRGHGARPYKSRDYIEKRYFCHPIYDYKVFKVINKDGITVAIFILRIQEYDGSRVIRFIDYIGDISYMGSLTKDIDDILIRWDAEYIDMYETGLDGRLLSASCWLPVAGSGNIIPNYFSPYERRNVDIHYCSSEADVILFRGDGDQDRPN